MAHLELAGDHSPASSVEVKRLLLGRESEVVVLLDGPERLSRDLVVRERDDGSDLDERCLELAPARRGVDGHSVDGRFTLDVEVDRGSSRGVDDRRRNRRDRRSGDDLAGGLLPRLGRGTSCQHDLVGTEGLPHRLADDDVRPVGLLVRGNQRDPLDHSVLD